MEGFNFKPEGQSHFGPETDKTHGFFDARSEVRNIRKLEDEASSLSKKDRVDLRKERLSDFKKRLANQMMEAAKLNAEIEIIALSSKKIAIEKLYICLEHYNNSLKLPSLYIDECRTVIEKLIERNKKVDMFFSETCKEKSDKEIFEYIFNQPPQGDVVFKQGPLSPIVFCDDIDVSHILSLGHIEIESQFAAVAISFPENTSPGLDAIENTVTIVRKNQKGEFDIESIAIHEEKHVFDKIALSDEKAIIRNELAQRLSKFCEESEMISDEQLNAMSLEEFVGLTTKQIEISLTAVKKLSEATAKQEILAFYKQGIDPNTIYAMLNDSRQGSGYAVIDERSRQAYDQQFEAMVGDEKAKNIVKEFLVKNHRYQEKNYLQSLFDGISAIKHLETIGMSRSEIIGLFETEPLGKWHKTFSRITGGDVYKQKNNIHSIKEVLENIEYTIKQSAETIKEVEQQIEKPSKESHLYKMWQNQLKNSYETYEKMLAFFLESTTKYLDSSLERKLELVSELKRLDAER